MIGCYEGRHLEIKRYILEILMIDVDFVKAMFNYDHTPLYSVWTPDNIFMPNICLLNVEFLLLILFLSMFCVNGLQTRVIFRICLPHMITIIRLNTI